MPGLWSTVTELDPNMQERLADVLETRGADQQQQEMRCMFLAEIEFLAQAGVLAVGCSTGVFTRMLARLPDLGAVVARKMS